MGERGEHGVVRTPVMRDAPVTLPSLARLSFIVARACRDLCRVSIGTSSRIGGVRASTANDCFSHATSSLLFLHLVTRMTIAPPVLAISHYRNGL